MVIQFSYTQRLESSKHELLLNLHWGMDTCCSLCKWKHTSSTPLEQISVSMFIQNYPIVFYSFLVFFQGLSYRQSWIVAEMRKDKVFLSHWDNGLQAVADVAFSAFSIVSGCFRYLRVQRATHFPRSTPLCCWVAHGTYGTAFNKTGIGEVWWFKFWCVFEYGSAVMNVSEWAPLLEDVGSL